MKVEGREDEGGCEGLHWEVGGGPGQVGRGGGHWIRLFQAISTTEL